MRGLGTRFPLVGTKIWKVQWEMLKTLSLVIKLSLVLSFTSICTPSLAELEGKILLQCNLGFDLM